MSRHKSFNNLTLSGCKCAGSTLLKSGALFYWDRGFDITFEADKVVFECKKCGEMVALFYREPEVEKNPVKLEGLPHTGKQVSVPRVVAWVGYAKNTKTVQIGIEQQETEARKKLTSALVSAGIPATEEQVEGFLHRYTTPNKMVDGLYKHIRYHIYKEAFYTNPSPRGLWFQDVSFEGTVQEVVTVKTGKYSSGGGYDGYCEGYSPPYLYDTETHRLYGCVSDEGQKALVWPGDVEEDNGSD